MIVKPCLRKILKDVNCTQYRLSKETGIAQGILSRFDSQTSHMDIHLFLIAKALHKNIDDLFEVIEDEKSEV